MRLKSIFQILLLNCFLILTGLGAQDNNSRLDSFFTVLEEHEKFMGSVSIREQNAVTYSKAVGWASVEDSIPLQPNTRFRIGSVTKMFTAVMIFQFIEEQAISLDTRLSRFFPRIPNAEKITISQLLSHRTGIHNFTNDPDYMMYMTTGSTKEDMLERIIEKGSDFTPDSTSAYSNANYVLLGYILEEISGEDFGTLLQKRVCEPLGLANTYLEDSIEIDENECHSFRQTGQRWFPMPETHMSIPHGAGAIVSTTADLTAFITALFNLELIRDASLQEMKTFDGKMGRGIFIFTFDTDTAYGHGGAIDGFRSLLYYFPKENVAISVCSNGLNYRMNKLAEGVVSLYFNKEFTIPTFDQYAISLTEEELKAYTGNFGSDNFPLDIRIFLKEGQLFGQATGQSSFPLNWESKAVLVFPAANIAFDFSNAEIKDGHYHSFVFSQGGPDVRFERKGE